LRRNEKERSNYEKVAFADSGDDVHTRHLNKQKEMILVLQKQIEQYETSSS